MRKKTEQFDWGTHALQGTEITKDAAAKFEIRLQSDPSDKEARAALLGYYCSGKVNSKSATQKQIRHVLWVLQNAPDCGLGVTPCLRLSKADGQEYYEQAKKILLQQCEKFRKDPETLMDLGAAIRHEEPALAIKILRQAYASGKGNKKDQIAFWLSTTLHYLGMQTNDYDSLREAVSLMQELARSQKPTRVFDKRFWLAKFAFDAEQLDVARDACTQMLSKNPENNQAVHVAHIVLGSMAFKEGNLGSACEHLILAGKVASSPRLCSYGPMMKLAQNLMESGEQATVKQYLSDCRKFWNKRILTKWIREIEAGGTPKLKGDDW